MKNKSVDADVKEVVGKRIVDALEGEIFAVAGTPTTTVKMKDGTYKNKPMVPGAEFSVNDAYVGKRGQIIFVFEPIDAQEFLIEVEARKMEEIFPTFCPVALVSCDDYPEPLNGDDLSTVISIMIRQEKKTMRASQETAAEREKERLVDVYGSNPLFGKY